MLAEEDDMDDSMRSYRVEDRSAFERIADQALTYLRTRTADHWLMFVAGVVLGLLIG
jgi:hypothetical protein